MPVVTRELLEACPDLKILASSEQAGVYAIATGDNKRAQLQSTVMQTLAKHPEIVQVHGFYYFENERRVSVDVVPDISVRDEAALCAQLTQELKALLPDVAISIVVDHNYSE